MKFSLPEILALGACALYALDKNVAATVALGLSIAGAIVRLSIELQREKKRDEIAAQALSMLSALGQYLDGTISGILYTLYQSSQDSEEIDKDDYN